MVELCLMASHGYPPGLGVGFHQEHVSSSRVFDVRTPRFLFFHYEILDSWCWFVLNFVFMYVWFIGVFLAVELG